jgi:hypothetical protein
MANDRQEVGGSRRQTVDGRQEGASVAQESHGNNGAEERDSVIHVTIVNNPTPALASSIRAPIPALDSKTPTDTTDAATITTTTTSTTTSSSDSLCNSVVASSVSLSTTVPRVREAPQSELAEIISLYESETQDPEHVDVPQNQKLRYLPVTSHKA